MPPIERFLQVAVNADREQYQPREEGTLAISAKDAYGRPVSAEIALGLVDESVKYIQQDYAGDPRQFYYGQKRQHTVQTVSTLDQKSYARYVEVEPGELRDKREEVDDGDVLAVRRKDGSRNAAGLGAMSESKSPLDELGKKESRGEARQTGNFAALAPAAKTG